MPTVARLKLAATDRGHGVQLGGVRTPDYGGVLKGRGHPYGIRHLLSTAPGSDAMGWDLATSGSADRGGGFCQTARSRCHSRFLLFRALRPVIKAGLSGGIYTAAAVKSIFFRITSRCQMGGHFVEAQRDGVPGAIAVTRNICCD